MTALQDCEPEIYVAFRDAVIAQQAEQRRSDMRARLRGQLGGP